MTRKLTTIEKAVRAIARPLNDRPREVWPHAGGIMLLDDSGGVCIAAFDDATALHFFLVWLREQRALRSAMLKAHDSAIRRRRAIKLVRGAE